MSLNILRILDLGTLHNHKANWNNGAYDLWTDYLVGDISPEEYTLERAESPSVYRHPDIYGLHPSESQAIDWTGGSEDISAPLHVQHYYLAPLAARYWKTLDSRYAERYVDLVHDFAVNGTKQVVPLQENAGSVLRHSFYLDAVFTSFSIITKALDDAQNSREAGKFADVAGLVDIEVLEDGSEAAILGAHLEATMEEAVEGLFEYLAPGILNTYEDPGGVINQRFAGLAALKSMTLIFGDNPTVALYQDRIEQAITNLTGNIARSDGGFFEASLNYNFGMNAAIKALVGMVKEVQALNDEGLSEPWLELDAQTERFDAMVQALQSPLDGSLAQIGNGYWGARLTVEEMPSMGQENFAAPLSGFYVQRSGWEDDQEDFLFFYDKVDTRGHVMNGGNSIQVAAHGQKLLVSGGNPNYWADADSKSDTYRSELSTWKTNTILVDGESQSRQQSQSLEGLDVVQMNRWLDSEVFDYVEGTYSAGYGETNFSSTNVRIDDVTHLRKVVYLEEEGIWVIVDTMKSATQYDYTQVWKFAQDFAKEHVQVDGDTNRIIGSNVDKDSEDSPQPIVNLEIQQFATTEIGYEQHHGSDGGDYGYFGTGVTANGVEHGVDLHAKFQGLGEDGDMGTVTVVTILNPFVGSNPADSGISYTDQSDATTNLVGADLVFASGSSLTIRAASTDEHSFGEAGNQHNDKDLFISLERADGSTAVLVTGDPENGTASYQQIDGEKDFILIPDTFSWETNDQGEDITNLFSVTATDDTVSAAGGTPVSINVIDNDTSLKGASLSVTSVSVQPEQGTAVVRGENILFIPAQGFTGQAEIAYSVSDGRGGTAAAVAFVNVDEAVEVLYGTSEDDFMVQHYHDTNGNVIDGLDGLDDVIHGDGGNDLIEAGLGDDTVLGGIGDDTIYGEGSSISQRVLNGDFDAGTLEGWTTTGRVDIDPKTLDRTTLSASQGEDAATLSQTITTVAGGECTLNFTGFWRGNATNVDSANTFDILINDIVVDSYIGQGWRSLNLNPVSFEATGPETTITFRYTDNPETLFNGAFTVDKIAVTTTAAGLGAGDDQLFGNEGNDTLFGGGGNDLIVGGGGDDWLYGEAGDDQLLGGLGHDLFILDAAGYDERIYDFEVGVDKIRIRGGG